MNLENYNLFIKVLKTFDRKCIEQDLPINVLNPILVQLDFLILDKLDYAENNIEKRITNLCFEIERKKGDAQNMPVFIMYTIVKLIEEKHDYFIKYKGDILKASMQSAIDKEENSQDEYWLTAWPPDRVVNNFDLFIEKVQLSKDIWMRESKRLRDILYIMVFQPPFDNQTTWSVLRGKE